MPANRKEQNRKYYLARKARLTGIPVEEKSNMEQELAELGRKLHKLQQEFKELSSPSAANIKPSANVIQALTK